MAHQHPLGNLRPAGNEPDAGAEVVGEPARRRPGGERPARPNAVCLRPYPPGAEAARLLVPSTLKGAPVGGPPPRGRLSVLRTRSRVVHGPAGNRFSNTVPITYMALLLDRPEEPPIDAVSRERAAILVT